MRSVKGELETPDSSRNDGPLEGSGTNHQNSTVERETYKLKGPRKYLMTNI